MSKGRWRKEEWKKIETMMGKPRIGRKVERQVGRIEGRGDGTRAE